MVCFYYWGTSSVWVYILPKLQCQRVSGSPPQNGSSVNKAISHVILVEQIYLELTPHGSVLPFLMGWVSGCSGNLPQKAFRQARLVAHQ